MIFKVEYIAEMEYLPTKRHKKTRMRNIERSMDVEIREPSEEEFPVAFVVHEKKDVNENARTYKDFDGSSDRRILSEEIRTYAGKLFRPVRASYGTIVSLQCESLDYIRNIFSRFSRYDYRHKADDFSDDSIIIEVKDEEQQEEFRKIAEDYIIFNGIVWKRCGEPVYHIFVYGIYDNRFSLKIEYCFEDNYHNLGYFCGDLQNVFNSLEMDKAVLKIREMMRDCPSHDTYFSPDEMEYIEVVMPEMVRADPQKEAEKIRIRENIGETDKILNDLQNMRNQESKKWTYGGDRQSDRCCHR